MFQLGFGSFPSIFGHTHLVTEDGSIRQVHQLGSKQQLPSCWSCCLVLLTSLQSWQISTSFFLLQSTWHMVWIFIYRHKTAQVCESLHHRWPSALTTWLALASPSAAWTMFSMIVLTESGLDHIKKHQLLGSQPCAQKRAGCFFGFPKAFFYKTQTDIYIYIFKSQSLLSYTLFHPLWLAPWTQV